MSTSPLSAALTGSTTWRAEIFRSSALQAGAIDRGRDAIGKLGEPKNVEQLLPFLSRPEKELRIEAIQALARISDERRAEHVRVQLQAYLPKVRECHDEMRNLKQHLAA